MKVSGRSIQASLVEQVIETAINAFSYAIQAQDFKNALNEYKSYGGTSKPQIKRYEELYDNWNSESETAKMTLESTSKEVLQESLNHLENSMNVGDQEKNQGAIQEIKNALGRGD
jgi:glutamyl-tRNA reductase